MNTAATTFAVIITSYNYRAFVAEAIDSAQMPASRRSS